MGWNLQFQLTNDSHLEQTEWDRVVGQHLQMGDGQDWRKVTDVVGRHHWSEGDQFQLEHLTIARKATEGEKNYVQSAQNGKTASRASR